MASTLKHLTTNLRARARRERWNERSWLVAPATLIVPDRVLNGSRGRLLYPKAEALKSPSSWDGVPLLLRHPEGNRSGTDALPTQGLGLWRNTTANGRLSGEAWFDEELVRHRDADLPPNQRILPRLLNGFPIELSTGLMTDDDETPGVLANGERYDATATNYRPDHVAILPDAKGACAVEHGCGVFNAEGEQVGSINLCSACGGDLDATGKCQACGWTNETVENAEASFFARFWSWLTSNANPKSVASGRWKLWGSGTGKGDAHEAAQRGRLVLTTDDQAKGADAKQQADAGHNPPGWAVDEDKWERAKVAADKGEYGPETYWAVVASIYQRMGGVIGEAQTENSNPEGTNQYTGGGGSSEGDSGGHAQVKEKAEKKYFDSPHHKTMSDKFGKDVADKVMAKLEGKKNPGRDDIAKELKRLGLIKSTIPSPYADSNIVKNHSSEQGDQDMAAKTKADNVQQLTTNCECWKGKADTLNKLTDVEVQAIADAEAKHVKNAEAAATLVKVLDAAGVPSTLNADEMPAAIKKKIEDKEEEDDEDEDKEEKKAKAKKADNHARKPRTVGEWLDMTDAPDAVKSVVRNAERVERDERERLSGILRGIAKNEEGDPKVRKLIESKLAAKPALDLGQLEELVVLTRPVRNQRTAQDGPDDEDRRPTRNGAQGSWQLTENEQTETLDITAAREEQGYMKPRQTAKTG